MSYSNPRWYGVGDPGSFTKGFESAFNTNFKNASDYFAAKEQELIDYNTNLENRADNLRNQLLTGKDVTPQIQKQVESQVQEFLKEGKTLEQEGKTFIGRALSTRINMKSKSELDKAQMNFMASSNVMNELLSNALSGELLPPEDLDRGSATYLDYVAILETVKKDPSKLNFKYKKGENDFDFTLEYKDPRTGESKILNSTEVAAIIEDNNTSVKKAIVKEDEVFKSQLFGAVKTELEMRAAKEFKSGPGVGGKAVLSEDVIRDVINMQIDKMSSKRGAPTDINRHDLLNDMFNNFVSFNDDKKETILGKESLLFKQSRVKDANGNVDNSKLEALSDLLDINRGDIKARSEAYKKLGITSKEDIEKANKELENYRVGATKEYLHDELVGMGVASKFLQAYRPYQTRTGRGSGSEDFNTNDPYVVQQTNKAFNVVASSAVGGKITDVLKPNTRIIFGGSTRTLGDVEENENTGEIKLIFPGKQVTQDVLDEKGKKTGQKETVTLEEETYTFNPWDIEETRQLYMTVSSSAGRSGDYVRDFETQGFNVNMARRFASPQGMKTLEDPRAGQWFQFAESYNRQGLIDYAAANPSLYSDAPFRVGMRPSVPHWRNFYQRNKGAIDRARSTRDLEAIRN